MPLTKTFFYVEKTTSFDLLNRLRSKAATTRGAPFSGGTQRGSNACPLHLLCKCGVPASGGVRLSNLLSSPHAVSD